jgi:hypothetical protein
MTEATTTYCRVCGHAKEHHDLDVHLDPNEDHGRAREEAEQGRGACHDMAYRNHHCICVEYQSWT